MNSLAQLPRTLGRRLARPLADPVELAIGWRASQRWHVPLPPGEGRPVLLAGGFGAPNLALRPLTDWLASAGWVPYVAHVNHGLDCAERSAQALQRQIEQLSRDYDARVSVLAHSRGGQFARVAVRRQCDDVRRLVTLGAPFAYVPASRLIQAQAAVVMTLGSAGLPGLASLRCLTGRCCASFRRDLREPWPETVAFTSIYSRADQTVGWEQCRDPAAKPVEVSASHVGMLTSKPSWEAIAGAL